jgi:predicted TPR repeat methyltransferase
VQLHQQGRFDAAIALYRQVLAATPRQFDALHLLGVIERQQGRPERAAELIRAALDVDPGQARAHSNLGAALQDLGNTQGALAAYDTALRLDPAYALAWDNRGNTLRRLGRPGDALASYERALALGAGNPDAWLHRALALADLGRHADAAASAGRALDLRPAFPDALLAFGNALQALDRPVEAIDAYERALALEAQRADIWCAHGAACKKSGDIEAALASYERALALRPDYAQAAHFRANALRALGRRDDAVAAYERAAALGADPEAVGFALAALGAGAAPAAAPAGYVKALFDQYAGHFDRHLVDVLGYRTPALLDALLRLHLSAHLPAGTVKAEAPAVDAALDLGCGTGLCGPVLRPLARHLAGVDLSPRMLDRAQATGLYDALTCADIAEAMAQRDAAWDLVVAADVLVYFGDLAPVFGQVRRALRTGGLFAFSCEALDPAGEGYAITASNRYAHTPAHIDACATAAGFVRVARTDATLRRDHGADVAGHVILRSRTRTTPSSRLRPGAPARRRAPPCGRRHGYRHRA